MKQTKQQSFFQDKVAKSFGGTLLKGNAKTKRTLSTKQAMHLVLKSKCAVGAASMLHPKHSSRIDFLIRKQAKLCGVRIYHFVNVGNHLHLVVRIQNRALYQSFIRSISGIIARIILKKQRGQAERIINKTHQSSIKDLNQKANGHVRFWLARPFTRLIAWGKDYKHVSNYMRKNSKQARFVAWGFDVLDAKRIKALETG